MPNIQQEYAKFHGTKIKIRSKGSILPVEEPEAWEGPAAKQMVRRRAIYVTIKKSTK